MEAFQLTEEYNTILFSWYFKGFEFLRRHLTKDPVGVDFENLDLEEVDKEIAADEASQSVALKDDAPGDAFPPSTSDDVAANT